MNSAAILDQNRTDCRINAGQMICDDACRDLADIGGAILFNASLRERIPGKFIFWGPYVGLAAGVYLVTVNGEMAGRMTLDFVCHQASTQLKTVTLEDLSQPVCLVLMQAVKDLEIRALKTPLLRSFALESIDIRCAYLAPQETGAEGAAAVAADGYGAAA